MKRRLLFVDDEPNLLNGLRRSLHGMRDEWEMVFLESAEAVLTELTKGPYDAVISDMRMPGMDGAALLEQVKELYPDTIRIILSGQSSRGSVFRSITPAHQFLAKPCDPEELGRRLRQAFATHQMLSNPSVKTVVSRMRSLPSLPSLYEEVTSELRKEEPSFRKIEVTISQDVGMATKILQLANSAFMGSSGRVSSLCQALILIGLENVRTLVLSVNVFSQFDGHASVAAHLPALWNHSIATSALAQRIAIAENCGKALVEECFTAGLLHDLGKLVLLGELPGEALPLYAAMSAASADAEREHLGCTHSEVGAYLMSIWGLPLSLVNAVAYHHCPREAGETGFSALTAVHVADAIVSETDPAQLNHDAAIDAEYLGCLGMVNKEPEWRSLHNPESSSGSDPSTPK